MRALHFIVAAAVGFLLYQFSVVFVGGLLAAVPVPSGYFEFFGPNRANLAHGVLGVILYALPTLLLVGGGVLASDRLLAKSGHHALFPYFVGLVASALLLDWLFAPGCLPSPESGSGCNQPIIQRIFGVPLWALPVVASPWLGFGLAAWLIRRNKAISPSGVA